jgi:Ring finger domain
MGNIWITGSKTCSTTAPALYFTALAWVIWGYCLLLLPIVALACIILCLPCFIIVFNVLHLGSPVSTRQGATEEQINHLPVFAFKTDQVEKEIINISGEDAKCSICLADYQEGEPVRKLGCQHHFHKSCVDQWLVISATCPLCVQSIIVSQEA